MAAWQYDFHLIPRAGVVDLYGKVPISLDRETSETADWWRGTAVSLLVSLISQLLEPAVSWDPNGTITWGKEDGDRVDVLFEAGSVRECFVRVDVRVLVKGFLVTVLRSSEQDWLVITPSLHALEPAGEAVINDLACSGAWKFVEDPEGFLRGLKQKPRPHQSA